MATNQNGKKSGKGDKKAAKAKAHRFHGMNKFGNLNKHARHSTPIARYLRTGIKDHACTGN